MRRGVHDDADLVLVAGRVHPFADEVRQAASIVAVRDGLIVRMVQEWEDVTDIVGKMTRVVKSDDLVLAPALADSHNHVITAARDLYAVPLESCESIADIQSVLREAAAKDAGSQWLTSTREWTVDQLRERRVPDRTELDAAVDARPVCIRPGAHEMVLNSEALRVAGIDRDTPSPPGGTIVRDAVGHPTGHLVEYPAFERILPFIAEPSEPELVAGLRLVHARYNASGIGVVRNAGIRSDELLIYQKLRAESGLNVRTGVLIRIDPAWSVEYQHDYVRSWQISSGFGDDLLRIEGIKVFVDGGLEASAVYTKDGAVDGLLFTTPAAFADMLTLCWSRGIRVAAHAIGDAAIDVVLAGYRRATSECSSTGSLIIEHGWLMNVEQRVKVAQLGIAVSTQYAHFRMQAEGSMREHWGEGRVEGAVPLRSLIDFGILVALGSDWNVTPGHDTRPFDPLLTLHTSVTREVGSGRVINPAERITPAEAYALHSVNSAIVSGVASRRGALSVGRLADITGFHGDPLEQLARGERPTIALTVVEGRVVFASDSVEA